MKYFLYLAAAAAVFLPALIIRMCGIHSAKVPYESILTELKSVQTEIVNLHNKLRRIVDPAAANMLKMNWSEEAAYNARELSKFCDVVESNALKRRITNTFCGENMYLTSHPVSWTDVIRMWYNESKYFRYGAWSPTAEDKVTHHYTQMVWASSYLIGCGVSSCCKRLSPQYLYVCHYCHEGNDPHRINQPYISGHSCEKCPSNCENKLCTNPCIYYDEYINCHEQKMSLGCGVLSVKLQCRATCSCFNKII